MSAFSVTLRAPHRFAGFLIERDQRAIEHSLINPAVVHRDSSIGGSTADARITVRGISGSQRHFNWPVRASMANITSQPKLPYITPFATSMGASTLEPAGACVSQVQARPSRFTFVESICFSGLKCVSA